MTDQVTNLVDATAIQSLNLPSIAFLICKTWKNAKGESTINAAATPYLQAMSQIDNVNSMYGCDDGKSIVLYFLGNASAYRGEQAKIVKAELKRRTK